MNRKTTKKAPKKIQMSMVDMHHLLRLMAETESASTQLMMKQAAKSQLLQQIDPEGKVSKLDGEIDGLKMTANLKHLQYQELMRRIEKELGISFADYNINDLTGELVPAPKD